MAQATPKGEALKTILLSDLVRIAKETVVYLNERYRDEIADKFGGDFSFINRPENPGGLAGRGSFNFWVRHEVIRGGAKEVHRYEAMITIKNPFGSGYEGCIKKFRWDGSDYNKRALGQLKAGYTTVIVDTFGLQYD